MIEFLAMDGHGPYVWTAYGITLAALVFNYWSAERRLRRNLRKAKQEPERPAAPRKPTVTEL